MVGVSDCEVWGRVGGSTCDQYDELGLDGGAVEKLCEMNIAPFGER